MMHRLADWQSRLERFLQENRTRRFVYGEWDCCLFAAAAIQVMTGTHPHPEYIGTYSTRVQCRDLIRRETGHSGVQFIWRKVMQEHGIEEGPPGFAQRGNPVLIKRGSSGYSVGIIGFGGEIEVAASLGLKRASRAQAVSSWRV